MVLAANVIIHSEKGGQTHEWQYLSKVVQFGGAQTSLLSLKVLQSEKIFKV